MRVECPHCGTEFELGKSNCYCMGDPNPESNEVIGQLVPVTGPKTTETTTMENKTMENINTTNLDLATLANMVAEKIKANDRAVTETVKVNGGKFAKTSKFYGKELCGFMYDPFMVARFLPKNFRTMMQAYDRNMDEAIKAEVPYMEQISFLIEECHRLSYMGLIAFRERSRFWSTDTIRSIFIRYFRNMQSVIDDKKNDIIKEFSKKRRPVKYFKWSGKKINASMNVNIIKLRNGLEVPEYVLSIDWTRERDMADAIHELEGAKTYKDLYLIMESKRGLFMNLPSYWTKRYLGGGKYQASFRKDGFEIDPMFIEGYKAKGAYYTLKDEIIFSHKPYKGLYGRDAISLLRNQLTESKWEAYRFYAALKEMM